MKKSLLTGIIALSAISVATIGGSAMIDHQQNQEIPYFINNKKLVKENETEFNIKITNTVIVAEDGNFILELVYVDQDLSNIAKYYNVPTIDFNDSNVIATYNGGKTAAGNNSIFFDLDNVSTETLIINTFKITAKDDSGKTDANITWEDDLKGKEIVTGLEVVNSIEITNLEYDRGSALLTLSLDETITSDYYNKPTITFEGGIIKETVGEISDNGTSLTFDIIGVAIEDTKLTISEVNISPTISNPASIINVTFKDDVKIVTFDAGVNQSVTVTDSVYAREGKLLTLTLSKPIADVGLYDNPEITIDGDVVSGSDGNFTDNGKALTFVIDGVKPKDTKFTINNVTINSKNDNLATDVEVKVTNSIVEFVDDIAHETVIAEATYDRGSALLTLTLDESITPEYYNDPTIALDGGIKGENGKISVDGKTITFNITEVELSAVDFKINEVFITSKDANQAADVIISISNENGIVEFDAGANQSVIVTDSDYARGSELLTLTLNESIADVELYDNPEITIDGDVVSGSDGNFTDNGKALTFVIDGVKPKDTKFTINNVTINSKNDNLATDVEVKVTNSIVEFVDDIAHETVIAEATYDRGSALLTLSLDETITPDYYNKPTITFVGGVIEETVGEISEDGNSLTFNITGVELLDEEFIIDDVKITSKVPNQAADVNINIPNKTVEFDAGANQSVTVINSDYARQGKLLTLTLSEPIDNIELYDNPEITIDGDVVSGSDGKFTDNGNALTFEIAGVEEKDTEFTINNVTINSKNDNLATDVEVKVTNSTVEFSDNIAHETVIAEATYDRGSALLTLLLDEPITQEYYNDPTITLDKDIKGKNGKISDNGETITFDISGVKLSAVDFKINEVFITSKDANQAADVKITISNETVTFDAGVNQSVTVTDSVYAREGKLLTLTLSEPIADVDLYDNPDITIVGDVVSGSDGKFTDNGNALTFEIAGVESNDTEFTIDEVTINSKNPNLASDVTVNFNDNVKTVIFEHAIPQNTILVTKSIYQKDGNLLTLVLDDITTETETKLDYDDYETPTITIDGEKITGEFIDLLEDDNENTVLIFQIEGLGNDTTQFIIDSVSFKSLNDEVIQDLKVTINEEAKTVNIGNVNVSNDGLSGEAITAIVIGSLIVIAVIAGVVHYIYKAKKF